jgi:nicotinate phosphoribosyltransferase
MGAPPPPPLVQSPLSLGLDAFEAVTACVHSGMAGARATFDFAFEANAAPPYLVLAGLEPLLDALERLKLRADELAWLREAGAVDDPTMQRLAAFQFQCDIDAPPEGSLVFPGEPVITVEGPLWQAQLVEGFVISAIEDATHFATHIARCAVAAEPAEVIEGCSTRLHRLGGNAMLARAAFVGGAGATTNALAGRRYEVPVRARQPASFVLAHTSEAAAFEAWLRAVPDQAILRVDVRDAHAGIERAVGAIRSRATASWSDAPIAIEIGGGDLVGIANDAQRAFERAGLRAPVIVASGDMTPERIDELRRSGAPIAAYVIEDIGSRGHATYDLVAIEHDGQWSSRVRTGRTASDSTVPGRKTVLRYFDADGRPVGDVVHGASERHQSPKEPRLVEYATGLAVRLRDAASSAPLSRKVLRSGKRVATGEPARDARERAQRTLSSFPEPFRRLAGPARYPCGITQALQSAQAELLAKLG